MKIALAQVNTTVGDVSGNARRALEAVRRGEEAGADLVLLPELALTGYPPRDLLLRGHLAERCHEAIDEIARQCRGRTAAVIGMPALRRVVAPHDTHAGRGLYNSAAVCGDGRVLSWYHKRLLPTYDVFDEHRYFSAGSSPGMVEWAGKRIGLTICEDLWNEEGLIPREHRYGVDVVGELAALKPDVLVNISASPFALGKPRFRLSLFGMAARRLGVPLACVNLVAGNDDLIFDGHSALLGADGQVAAAAAGFVEDFLVVETEQAGGAGPFSIDAPEMEQLFEALVLGIRDYMRKCGFRGCIIALSGGIDSALVACLARAAVPASAIRTVGMPSRYSSAGSVTDARVLAEALGVRFDVLGIEPVHASMLEVVGPLLREVSETEGTAEENIQARIRGNIVMALSNKTGALLLTTGNKSEIAVGYCTLYGDMAGGLAVISDVPKTLVYDLSRWINAHPERLGLREGPIPESTLTKAPSAELRPGQTDQETLPPYEVLDEIIERYVEGSESVDRIIAETGFAEEVVRSMCRRIDGNEYKRRQAPIGLKVTGRAFGSGWRMPIAAKTEGR